jgi:hypothetical protein
MQRNLSIRTFYDAVIISFYKMAYPIYRNSFTL